MSFLTFNMEGFQNLPSVFNLANCFNPAIIALQETWLRTSKNFKLSDPLRDYKFFFKNSDSQLHEEDMVTARNLSFHGVAMGFHRSIQENIVQLEIADKGLIAARYRTETTDLVIINAYLPTRGFDGLYSEALDAMSVVIANNPDSKICIMGDLNTDIDSSPRRIVMWMEFLAMNELEDHQTGIITHHHHITGRENELDRFVTRGLNPDIKVLEEITSSSDHDPVIARIGFEVRQKKIPPKGEPIETKVNINKLHENLELFQELTNEIAEAFKQRREDFNRDTQNGLVSSLIFQAAVAVTGQDRLQSQVEKKSRKYRIPKELHQNLREAKREQLRERRGNYNTGARKKVRAARQIIRNYINSKIEEDELDLHRRITEAANQRSSKVFGLLKKLKQADRVENKLPSVIEGYGEKFVSPYVLDGMRELFRLQTTMDFIPRFHGEKLEAASQAVEARKRTKWLDEEYQTIDLTREDFDKLISALKPGKAQDFLGLSNDLLKRVGEGMKSLLYEMLVETLQKRDIGGLIRNFGKGTIIIKKPGKPTTLIGTWRKIVVNNTLNNVLQYRVQPAIEKKVQAIQTRNQLGFTPGVPVNNAVVARQELQAISKKMKKTLFFGVLDLQSCFPRICRQQMLLLATGILNPAEWDMLSQIYHQTWGEIRIEGQRSKPAKGDIGSIEGGVLSVQILKIYISVLLLALKRAGFSAEVDLTSKKLRAGALGVADDILLFAWSEKVLQQMLSVCQHWSDAFRATFSPTKSVVLIQRAPKDKKTYGPFMMNGVEMDIVEVAEHLGILIDETGDNSKRMIEDRMSKARRGIHGTMSIFDPKSFVNTALKIELWRKQYRMIILYGLDTTELKMSQVKKIETFQMKILRSMFRLSSRASSCKVRLLAGIPTMNFEILRARFGSLNNILMGETLTAQYCVLSWICQLSGTWTYETVKKLNNILQSEGIGEKIKAEEMFYMTKKSFKEAMKNILTGAELRKISRELEKTKETYKIPQLPFKTVMPLVNSDFSSYSTKLVRAFAAVYTGDYFKNFSGRCFLCQHKAVGKDEEELYRDDTRHLLSSYCDASQSPEAESQLSYIKYIMNIIRPSSPISTEVVSQTFLARFILNPTCLSLGASRVSPDDLQHSGLDTVIKKFCLFRLKKRYELLHKRGFIVKKRRF